MRATASFCKSEAKRLAALEVGNKTDPPNVFRRKSHAAGVGGTLKRTGGGPNVLDFSLLVVNGMNTGELDGKASRRGNVFVFSEENPATEKPCTLVFYELQHGFAVVETSLCPHGAGVEFGGNYVNEAPVTKASFDCQKAQSPTERTICADEVLGALDLKLDAAYRTASAGDAGVKAAQQAWLGDVARCADNDAADAVNHEASTQCLLGAYRSRIRALEARPPAASDGIELFERMKATAEARFKKRGRLDFRGWVVEQAESAAILRTFLGRATFYELRSFVDGFDPQVDAGYVTTTGAPAGLRGINEGFLTIGAAGDLWAAILRPADDRPPKGLCIDLWSHGALRGVESPPSPFERWRSRFPDVPVLGHELGAR